MAIRPGWVVTEKSTFFWPLYFRCYFHQIVTMILGIISKKQPFFPEKWDKRADILLYFYNKEKKTSFFCSNYHAKSSSQFGENNVDILVAKKMLVFLFQITLLSWHFFWKTRSNFKWFCYQIPKKSRIYQCIFHKKKPKNRHVFLKLLPYFILPIWWK